MRWRIARMMVGKMDVDTHTTLNVNGMTCAGCATRIHDHFVALPGIHSVSVGLLTHKAEFDHNDLALTAGDIVQELVKIGFTGSVVSSRSVVEGAAPLASVYVLISPYAKSSRPLASIVSAVEEQLASSDKISEARGRVDNPERGIVEVSFESGAVHRRSILEAVKKIVGSDASARVVNAAKAAPPLGKSQVEVWRTKLWWCLLLVTPIVLIDFILPSFKAPAEILGTVIAFRVTVAEMLMFLLASPIQLYIAIPIYTSAWGALRYNRRANMDTLITLSTCTAYGYSLVVVVARAFDSSIEPEVFFATAAYLVTLITFGRWMELLAKSKTSAILEKLNELQPQTAMVLHATAPPLQLGKSGCCTSGKKDAGSCSSTKSCCGDAVIDTPSCGATKPTDRKESSCSEPESSCSGQAAKEKVVESKSDGCCSSKINECGEEERTVAGGPESGVCSDVKSSSDVAEYSGGKGGCCASRGDEAVADEVERKPKGGCCSNGNSTSLYLDLECASSRKVTEEEALVSTEDKCCAKDSKKCSGSKRPTSDSCGNARSAPKEGSVSDNDAEEVDVDLVDVGDLLRVLPGALIPVDGVVVEGRSTVDESMVTGESTPVAKDGEAASVVIGGTINGTGSLVIRASKDTSTGMLASICTMVEDAQLNKPSVEEFGDRIAAYFVPFLVASALLTFTVWYFLVAKGLVPSEHSPSTTAIMFALTLLVISCPCAFSLASPTAIMVGTGVAAKNGLLVKSGASLEQASKITAVVFDKTGTLTTGHLTVTDVVMCNATDGQGLSMWDAICSIEQRSEHPLAAAMMKYAAEEYDGKVLECLDATAVPGCGIEGTVHGTRVMIGNLKWLEERSGRSDLTMAKEKAEKLSREAKTVVGCVVDGVLLGLLAMADAPKEDSAFVVSQLEASNVSVWMLSGDNLITARAIADELGIAHERVVAEVLPSEKADHISALQRDGHVVCMVGDGINDSVSLVQADVGVAIGAGAEIAVEAADCVMVHDSLLGIITLLHLSKTVMRVIKGNFLWGALYNIFAIPFSAGVLYPLIHWAMPPSIAGLSELLSSLPVVVFSLLLNFYRPPAMVQFRRSGYIPTGENVELVSVAVE